MSYKVMRFLPGVARVSAIGVFAIGLLFSPLARASYSFQFDTVFSGTNSPAAPAPWVAVAFQDVTPGTVKVTISNPGLTGSEFIGGLYLNLNPGLNPNGLVFTPLSSSGGFTLPQVNLGTNQFRADGDGKYDILLSFDTADGMTFTGGDFVSYQVTGIPTLDSSSFDFLSQPAGGAGPFLAAAHVQSIGSNGDSDWIRPTQMTPVPEPSVALTTILLGGLWLGGGWVRRVLRTSQSEQQLAPARISRIVRPERGVSPRDRILREKWEP
jgi:hypothetical protein